MFPIVSIVCARLRFRQTSLHDWNWPTLPLPFSFSSRSPRAMFRPMGRSPISTNGNPRSNLQVRVEIYGPLDNVPLPAGFGLGYCLLRVGKNPALICAPGLGTGARLAFEQAAC